MQHRARMLQLTTFWVLLFAAQFAFASYIDGNKLQEWLEAQERVSAGRGSNSDLFNSGMASGYIMAISDAFEGGVVCVPTGAGAKQVIAVERKYLVAHPEAWNQPAPGIALFALREAFPCKKG